jgi:prepilin-type N-terminal cleavage/methylation domain-containing protein
MKSARTRRPRAARNARGFTLIELAVGVFIIALLLGSVLVPLRTQVESRRIDETQRILENAREALLGYAAAYGYFPCPADSTSNGYEPAAGVDHATGACPSYHGFLPAALLGITPVDGQGYAIDAWAYSANRIRYSISNYTVGGIATPFTRSGGMAAATIPALGAAANLFHVCASGIGVNGSTDCGTAGTLTSRAVFVVWSAGANATTGGGTSAHEAQNLNGNRLFVSRARSNVAGGEFDDILVWVAPALVVSRLVAAAQLP